MRPATIELTNDTLRVTYYGKTLVFERAGNDLYTPAERPDDYNKFTFTPTRLLNTDIGLYQRKGWTIHNAPITSDVPHGIMPYIQEITASKWDGSVRIDLEERLVGNRMFLHHFLDTYRDRIEFWTTTASSSKEKSSRHYERGRSSIPRE